MTETGSRTSTWTLSAGDRPHRPHRRNCSISTGPSGVEFSSRRRSRGVWTRFSRSSSGSSAPPASRLLRTFRRACPTSTATADHLKQVFLNLVINARDAMEDGGTADDRAWASRRPRFTSRFATPARAFPEISSRRSSIRSSRPRDEQGTGLGLSVCHGIIKSHNGSITFRNAAPGRLFRNRTASGGLDGKAP